MADAERDEKGPIVRSDVESMLEIIRPALRVDGGDVALVAVDEVAGVVTVQLSGACVGCTGSSRNALAGIERILKDRVAGVSEVVALPSSTGQCSSDGTPVCL